MASEQQVQAWIDQLRRELSELKSYSSDYSTSHYAEAGRMSGTFLGLTFLSGILRGASPAAISPTTWAAPTLINSWANFGSPHSPAGYLVDALGFVHLRGLIKSGTAGSNAFVLPTGYQPANEVIIAVMANNGAATGYLAVQTDGTVQVNGSWAGGATDVSLDCSFPTF